MEVNRSARAGRKALVANFSRNTTVFASGASILSTIVYQLWRGLMTPSGGWMMCSQLAFTSEAVNGAPSWDFTPSRSLKVEGASSSVGIGISVHRSHTRSVVDNGV